MKRKTRLIIYLLCAIAFGFIEFERNTLAWGISLGATNCIGLLLFAIILTKVDLKWFTKSLMIPWLLSLGMAECLTYTVWNKIGYRFDIYQGITAVANVWWMALMLVYFYNKIFITKEIKVTFSKTSIVWSALVVVTIISRSKNIWPAWFFLIFGFFYLCSFSKSEKTDFVNCLCDGIIISFLIIQGAAFLFRPYDIVRYSGMFTNCNCMACFYMLVYIFLLYRIYSLKTNNAPRVLRILFFLAAAGMQGFIFLTICRTVWIADVVVTFLYGIIVVKDKWNLSLKKTIGRGFLLLTAFFIMFPMVFVMVRYLPTVHPHPIWWDAEYNEERVHSWDARDSEKYVELDELVEAVVGRFVALRNEFVKSNPLVLSSYAAETVSIGEESSSLNMRKDIWKAYLQNSGWLGNSFDSHHFICTTEDGESTIYHAQNLWIQVTYDYGYIATTLLLLLTVLIISRGYRFLKNSDLPEDILPFFVSVFYFMYGIMETVWLPGYLILTLMFIIQHPMFGENNKAKIESMD